MKPIPCEHCTRRFSDTNGLRSHMKMKHPNKPRKHLAPEREPSMADLVIEAQINRAVGLPVERWLADMFDI